MSTERPAEFSERALVFGEKVRRRLADLGMTQGQLIERTGLSRSYVKVLLNRQGYQRAGTSERTPPNPTLDVIWRLSEVLEVDPAYLVDHTRGVGE